MFTLRGKSPQKEPEGNSGPFIAGSWEALLGNEYYQKTYGMDKSAYNKELQSFQSGYDGDVYESYRVARRSGAGMQTRQRMTDKFKSAWEKHLEGIKPEPETPELGSQKDEANREMMAADALRRRLAIRRQANEGLYSGAKAIASGSTLGGTTGTSTLGGY